jgi:large subunit ribosomal protein L4
MAETPKSKTMKVSPKPKAGKAAKVARAQKAAAKAKPARAAKPVKAEKKAKPAKPPKVVKPVKAKPDPKTAPVPAKTADGALVVTGAHGRATGEVKLAPSVFELRPNDHLLYEAVKLYRAGGRAGTHKTKSRGDVSGSGKKPWKQKGTGQARVGEKRTPLWRHGGTVFGPTPRDYSYSMPKKALVAALRQALSTKNRTGSLRIIESLTADEPKTKALKAAIDAMNFDGKTVYVESEPSDALLLSSRNIPGFRVIETSHLTVYDILNCKTLAVSTAALSRLEERLSR